MTMWFSTRMSNCIDFVHIVTSDNTSTSSGIGRCLGGRIICIGDNLSFNAVASFNLKWPVVGQNTAEYGCHIKASSCICTTIASVYMLCIYNITCYLFTLHTVY
jgi:hypothetical protein